MISDELELTNLFVGLFIFEGQPLCPFRDLEMQLVGVQRPVRVVFDGQLRPVVPEVLLAAPDGDYAIVLDVKSKTVQELQLRKYHALDHNAIAQSLGRATHPNGQHDVSLFTVKENVPSLRLSVRTALAPIATTPDQDDFFPLLGCDEVEIRTEVGKFRHQRLEDAFRVGVSVEGWQQAPQRFILFTGESKTRDILPHVMQFVLTRVVQQTDFTVRDTCEALLDNWEVRGQDDRKRIWHKIYQILKKASDEDFRPFFRLERPPHESRLSATCLVTRRRMNHQRIESLMRSVDRFSANYKFAEDKDFTSAQLPLTIEPEQDSNSNEPSS